MCGSTLDSVKGVFVFSVNQGVKLDDIETELRKTHVRGNGTFRDGSSVQIGALFKSIDPDSQQQNYLWDVTFLADMNGKTDGAEMRFQSILDAENKHLAGFGHLQLMGVISRPQDLAA